MVRLESLKRPEQLFDDIFDPKHLPQQIQPLDRADYIANRMELRGGQGKVYTNNDYTGITRYFKTKNTYLDEQMQGDVGLNDRRGNYCYVRHINPEVYEYPNITEQFSSVEETFEVAMVYVITDHRGNTYSLRDRMRRIIQWLHAYQPAVKDVMKLQLDPMEIYEEETGLEDEPKFLKHIRLAKITMNVATFVPIC